MTVFPPFEPERMKLLVVEDEIIIGEHLCMTLKGLGYCQVRLAANGQAALEALRQDPPDLVLMDISLPGQMDGLQAAHRILEIRALPIIFITGNTDPALRRQAQELEPYGFIPKPFNRLVLDDQIQMAMIRWKTERRLKRLTRCYETILEQADHGILVIDLGDESILGANSLAWQILNLDRCDLRKRSIRYFPQLESILAEAGLPAGKENERRLHRPPDLDIHIRSTQLEDTALIVLTLEKKNP